MKKILFTGGTGFIGRNLLPFLKNIYDVSAPSRNELNLTDPDSIENYFINHKFDVVIHAAIPNIAFNKDKSETLLKDSLFTFMKLYQQQEKYEKLIYFGSGAEFDKTFPIISISEEEFGKRIPNNDYGLAKYSRTSLERKSEKIYNLRIFGCYGPTDADFKLITYAIHCCMDNKPIVLHQDCIFDYMHVSDIYPVLNYFIENTPKYHDYNICTGNRISILEICKYIQKEMNCNLPIQIEKPGFNNEYTGQNLRICQEIPNLKFTPLQEGIKRQIIYEKEAYGNEKKSS